MGLTHASDAMLAVTFLIFPCFSYAFHYSIESTSSDDGLHCVRCMTAGRTGLLSLETAQRHTN